MRRGGGGGGNPDEGYIPGVAVFATVENRRVLKGKDALQIDQIHRQISRLTALLGSCLAVLPRRA